MTNSKQSLSVEERLRERMNFAFEAFTLREIRGWPNDPVHNAAIVYELHGWTFDRRDAAMIRAEARSRSPLEDNSNG